MRAAPINFLRIFLAVLGILFAYQLGRVATDLRTRGLPMMKASTWFLRIAVIAFAIFWVGGFDWVTIAALALMAVAFGGGVWTEMRPKHDDSIHLDLPK